MFKKLFHWILRTVKIAAPFINKNILPAIELVEAIKKIAKSDNTDLFVKLTPTTWDDDFKAKFLPFLDKAISVLNIGYDFTQAKTLTEKLLLLLEILRISSEPMRNAIYHQLALNIAKASDGGSEYKDHVLGTLISAKFSEFKEKIEDEIDDKEDDAKPSTKPAPSKAAGTKNGK